MVDLLSVDSIEGHNQVSGKGFPTTEPRIEAGNVVIHRGLHVSNVTASCSLCAIGCKELFTDRHRCPDVLYIVVMLMGYVVDWNCMLMDFTILRLGVSFGITGLIRASFGITRLICASFEITRLICASFGITRLIGVRVQRGADRREAGRMREGHMDASAPNILHHQYPKDLEIHKEPSFVGSTVYSFFPQSEEVKATTCLDDIFQFSEKRFPSEHDDDLEWNVNSFLGKQPLGAFATHIDIFATYAKDELGDKIVSLQSSHHLLS
ncbi:hypothetical protein E5676_scaffold66G00810 [Cucumis melo var. makuwa]|uniref:Ty3-gypsy retrotransposon protein n=1 Tax=Cucumis melo var. makuwa TaxID=1194695 RepID=A0A5D3CGR5_CUCMM|nr:hypothetical protein E5676_scaffold66G00810 [Cucumis melo var. makuwa]